MECVFCEIVAGRSPAHVVVEDERTMAFMDIAPLVPGHVLIVPRIHVAAVWDMSPDDGAALMRAALRVARAVNSSFEPEGLNLFHSTGEVAGQTVFHVHLHVVPRWADDGFRPPLLPERAANAPLPEMAARIRGALD